MSAMLAAVHAIASQYPDRIAFEGADQSISYAVLDQTVTEASIQARDQDIRVFGLLADNGVPWALSDLAAIAANIPMVPLPLFFSPQQMLHAIRDTGLDALLCDQPQQVEAMLTQAGIRHHRAGMYCGLHLIRLHSIPARELPPGTARVTYTSGTTGAPKGVCLSLDHIETVAAALAEASEASIIDRHLCLTPLSTLLENIGGIYTPLLAGATSTLLPLQQVGLKGAAGIDAARMVNALQSTAASTAILAPQMLQGIVAAGESGMPMPDTLRFLAVGGAPVSPMLLARAQRLGLPVFEGYGLSECASVIALNQPGQHRANSVGKPLPHVHITFSETGEILVESPVFLGYLGEKRPPHPFPTGDLGYLDSQGFLHVTGRSKSLFITSFGRNVAPEWVERELTLHPAIAQAAVFGEGRPFNTAVIVPPPGTNPQAIEKAVQQANHMLPDYARIGKWIPATAPFSPSNQQLTSNGRLKRDNIHAMYAEAIEQIYQEETDVVF